MLAAFARPWCALLLTLIQADIQMDLYQEAKRSPILTALQLDSLDDFTGPRRPMDSVAVMFHDGSCKICQAALPEFHKAAKALQEREANVNFGHMDCSSNKDLVRQKFRLSGFPAILMWRARTSTVEFIDVESMVGIILHVVDDGGLMLRSSRLAKMGADNDAARLRALGKSGSVLAVDGVDQTAKLSVPGGGNVWLPFETLRQENNLALPFHRAETPVKYQGAWNTETMLSFAERLLHPFVMEVGTWQDFLEAVDKEKYPALVFCGARLTRGFEEAAVKVRGKGRAFQVVDQPSSCPAADRGSPRVLSFSPTGQQWAVVTKKARAAAVVAGADTVADDDHLAAWAWAERFPGLMLVGYENFPELIHGNRSALLVATRFADYLTQEMSLVERQLQQLAKPTKLDAVTDEYKYGPESYSCGVMDGTLAGLASFGIQSSNLPRVLVMEGGDRWVEDSEKLTLANLFSDLQKVPSMWRMSDGPRGYAVWTLSLTAASYRFYEGLAVAAVGPAGQGVLPVLAVLVLVGLSKSMFEPEAAVKAD